MGLPSEVTSLLGSAGGYQIQRSLRFRAPASGYLSRTPATAGNRKTWTWSAWIKRGRLSSSPGDEFFMANSANNDAGNFEVRFNASDQLAIFGWTSTWRITTQVFRDPSAWYHLVIAVDTTSAIANNRIRIYVNGSEITSFATITNPLQNDDLGVNSVGIHRMSGNAIPDGLFFDGYMAEVNFIDGSARLPGSFGRTNPSTGVWEPIPFIGTYGTNGFYLRFTDNSAATATTIGRDFSGNGNNWTPTNISVTAGTTFDSMIDSPTNYADGGNGRGNYAVLNPIDFVGNQNTITAGNLDLTTNSVGISAAVGTVFVSSGKWYWEFTVGGVAGICQVGIGRTPFGVISTNGPYQSANIYTYVSSNGNRGNNNTTSAYGATYTTNDVIGVALDRDAGTLVFYKNNVSQGTAYSGLPSGEFTAIIGDSGNASTISGSVNFGQRPFAYTPPAGFQALNTQNLPTTTIQNGASAFDVALYTGNGGTRSVTGELFSPDLVWIKSRSAATDNTLYDTVRGAQLRLESNTTDAQIYEVNGLTSFDGNGFTVGSLAQINTNAATYVAWQWDESVRAGFDIVTYTGTGAALNVAHNLGVAPRMMLIRAINNTVADNWGVYFGSLTFASFLSLYLNLTTGLSSTSMWNNTAPTSTVFTVGPNNDVNRSGISYVAYLWADVAGFSRIGTYVGNASTDGPFVWCGFRPRWVMIKRTDSTGNWVILDTSMNPFNVANLELYPNLALAENGNAANDLDFLSNGFKIRNSSNDYNASGNTYVFAAFAENPFKIARAR